MASPGFTTSNKLKHVEWMWQDNPDSWSKSETATWKHYSDVENLIIEEAHSNKQEQVILDEYYIDFKNNHQISNTDDYRPRPIKREVRKREDKHLREERFMDLPVGPGRSFGGGYGWVSPFIIEVRRELGLQDSEKLPSNNGEIIPMLVEKAAQGIITEGKHIRKQREAEKLANMLLEKKNDTIQEVWKRCVYLYTLESFLYKILNSTMRLIGSEKDEKIWRSKIQTLGLFCLLLWDDPFNTRVTGNKILFRAADLKPEQIATYEQMAKNSKEYGSFQSFSSCSRNRQKAEEFGNALFIMVIKYAFIANLTELSEYPNEQEELITPGVCFKVQRVEFDRKKNKHFIYLKLQQRFSAPNKHEIQTFDSQNREKDKFDSHPGAHRDYVFDRGTYRTDVDYGSGVVFDDPVDLDAVYDVLARADPADLDDGRLGGDYVTHVRYDLADGLHNRDGEFVGKKE